jgi:hypothetical protein
MYNISCIIYLGEGLREVVNLALGVLALRQVAPARLVTAPLQRHQLIHHHHALRATVLKKIQGTFRDHSENIQGSFREHSGIVQGTFSKKKKKLKKKIREHSGYIQGTFREHSGKVEWTPVSLHQGTFREHSGLWSPRVPSKGDGSLA